MPCHTQAWNGTVASAHRGTVVVESAPAEDYFGSLDSILVGYHTSKPCLCTRHHRGSRAGVQENFHHTCEPFLSFDLLREVC
jgi:hypothetical protein